MDPYSSHYIIPNNNRYNPFPHCLLTQLEGMSRYVQLGEDTLLCGLQDDSG